MKQLGLSCPVVPWTVKYVQPSIVENQLSSVGDRICNNGIQTSERGVPLWSMVIMAPV